ncbi:MAG: DUF6879 family protein [Pseudonocardiaceae bacterium]
MLDEQELGDYIDSRFTRVLFRLETLDLYDVDSNGDEYRRYAVGEVKPDPERKKPWMEHIRGEIARDMHTYRVHVVRSPLNDYLRFECEWGYVYNARAGEHIRILDLAELPRPADLLDEDFWLIDDREVLRMHYDAEGRYVGGEIAPEGMLPRYLAAKNAAWSSAIDFSDYWRAHRGYWRDPSAV